MCDSFSEINLYYDVSFSFSAQQQLPGVHVDVSLWFEHRQRTSHIWKL